MPDFLDKYANYVMEKARNSGVSAEEIAKQVESMKSLREIYNNPIWNLLITLSEPLPVGLAVTLISALILRRRRKSLNDQKQLATS